MCGYSFSEEQTYLLYLYGPADGYYSTYTYSRTKLLFSAEDEIDVLNDSLVNRSMLPAEAAAF